MKGNDYKDPLHNNVTSDRNLLNKHEDIVNEVFRCLSTFISIYKQNPSYQETLLIAGLISFLICLLMMYFPIQIFCQTLKMKKIFYLFMKDT